MIVIGYTPPVPAAGVPASAAVPSPLSTNVTPDGREPVSESAGAGLPDVVTANDPALPVVNVVVAADVIAGAVPIVMGVSDSVGAKVRARRESGSVSFGPLPVKRRGVGLVDVHVVTCPG